MLLLPFSRGAIHSNTTIMSGINNVFYIRTVDENNTNICTKSGMVAGNLVMHSCMAGVEIPREKRTMVNVENAGAADDDSSSLWSKK